MSRPLTRLPQVIPGGQARTTPEVVAAFGGDMHEHLGQLIAYARMNKIVPPWSK